MIASVLGGFLPLGGTQRGKRRRKLRLSTPVLSGQDAGMNRLLFLGLVLVVIGCVGNTNRIPEPTPKMAMELGVEEAELVRGHAAYMLHCNRCHERIPPGKIDPEYWRGIVPHMAVYARIGEREENDLLLYLIAAHGTVHKADLEH